MFARGLIAAGMAIILAATAAAETNWPALQLSTNDRVMVLAPHPDDEVLGCGGVIQQAVRLHLPVRVVFLTYGDNNQWSFLYYRKHPVLLPSAVREMGVIRHDEAEAADMCLGLSSNALTFLGYPDFSTLHIWSQHWAAEPPHRAMLTRVDAVPYATAFRPGAPHKGEAILADLESVIKEFRPTAVFVTHPADANPDHRAFYLFARVALWDLEPDLRPRLYCYLIHYGTWPQPRGLDTSAGLGPPAEMEADVAWQTFALPPDDVVRKKAALLLHHTQYESASAYLATFVRTNELFGDFAEVPLRDLSVSNTLSTGRSAPPPSGAGELTEEEAAAFVGIETRTVCREGDELVLTHTFSRPLGKAVEAGIHVFGYRSDRPFKDMPKLHISVSAVGHSIYDQDTLLPLKTLEVIRQAREIEVRIPLSALGDPERILTSARTYLGEVPLDWVSWRVLDVRPKVAPGTPAVRKP